MQAKPLFIFTLLYIILNHKIMKKIFLNPKFYLALLFLGVLLAFFYFDLGSFLSLENFKENQETLQDFIAQNYFLINPMRKESTCLKYLILF